MTTPSVQKSPRRPDFDVLHLRGKYLTKIGGAWHSESGKAINVVLDLLPPDGKVTLAQPLPPKVSGPRA